MADLTKMKYRVISARNPKTGGTILRPVVTDRNTMSLKQLVTYAKTANYVRGQQKDLEGLLGGFIEAMKDRAQAGYSMNINDWFIISGHLKGSVGENRQLTDENEYHVTITATKDLKVDIDNFSWTNIDDSGALISVGDISSPNGNAGEIIKTKAIVANGKNLVYNAAWGDTVTISYEGLETPIAITPTEQSASYLRFDWPTALDDVEVGTKLTLVFTLHGKEDGGAQPVTKVVTLVAA